jgi:O-antigen ligase
VYRLDVAFFLSLAALLLPALGILAPAGTAPLLAVAALGVLATGGRPVVTELRRLKAVAALLAAIGLWGGVSAAWSIAPGQSLFEAGRFLLLAFAGLVLFAGAGTLDETARRRIGTAMVAGLVLGLAVLAIELLGDHPLRRLEGDKPQAIPIVWLDRGAQILVLAAVPAAAALRRLWTIGLLALAVALALWPLMSSTAVVSLGAAFVAFAIGQRWPRFVGAAGAAVFIALTIAMPLAQPSREAIGAFHQALPSIRGSAHHRLVIWNWTVERIGERPLLGWGMDASRSMPGREIETEAYMPLRPYGLDITGQVLPLHPHDAILQWWLELGVVGVVLGAALAVFVWLQAGLAGAYPLALTAAAMPPLLLSFGVWQSWWLSTLFLVAALLRTAPKRA